MKNFKVYDPIYGQGSNVSRCYYEETVYALVLLQLLPFVNLLYNENYNQKIKKHESNSVKMKMRGGGRDGGAWKIGGKGMGVNEPTWSWQWRTGELFNIW